MNFYVKSFEEDERKVEEKLYFQCDMKIFMRKNLNFKNTQKSLSHTQKKPTERILGDVNVTKLI